MPQEERRFKKLTIVAIWMDLFQQELAHQCAEGRLEQALETATTAPAPICTHLTTVRSPWPLARGADTTSGNRSNSY